MKDTQTGRVHDFESALRDGLVKEDTLESYIHERGATHQHYPSTPAGRSQDFHSGPVGSHSPRLVERKLQLTPYAQDPTSHQSQSYHETSTSSTHRADPFREPSTGSGASFVRSQIDRFEPPRARTEVQPFQHGRTAHDEKLVDLGGGKNVMVKVVRGDDGLEKGEYVDPSTGMKFTIQLVSN